MNKVAPFAMVVIFSVVGALYPQDRQLLSPPTPVSAENDNYTISKRVDEVNLILAVTDHKGRFVDNLTANDFKLLDNHKSPAKWNYFQSRTDLSLHVILAIDVRASISERLGFEQRAAGAFLRHILRKGTDEAAIVAFGDTVQEKTAGMTGDVGA